MGLLPGPGTTTPSCCVAWPKKKKSLSCHIRCPTIQPLLTSLAAYEPVFDLVSQTSQAFLTSEPLFVRFLVLKMLFLMAFLLALVFIPKIAAKIARLLRVSPGPS